MLGVRPIVVIITADGCFGYTVSVGVAQLDTFFRVKPTEQKYVALRLSGVGTLAGIVDHLGKFKVFSGLVSMSLTISKTTRSFCPW